MKSYKDVADRFADECISGEHIVGKEIVAACERYKKDLQREDIELRTHDPDLVIGIMQSTLVHAQGEDLEGQPLLGKPFVLQPWQIFVVYKLLGFFYKGTNNRRYKEAFIMIGRKNGKTSFIAAFSFAVAIIQRRSGSTIYVVAAALKQALESFNFFFRSIQRFF